MATLRKARIPEVFAPFEAALLPTGLDHCRWIIRTFIDSAARNMDNEHSLTSCVVVINLQARKWHIFFFSLSLYLSLSPPLPLSLSLSVSVYLSIYLSIYLYIYLSVYVCVCLFLFVQSIFVYHSLYRGRRRKHARTLMSQMMMTQTHLASSGWATVSRHMYGWK